MLLKNIFSSNNLKRNFFYNNKNYIYLLYNFIKKIYKLSF